MDGCNDPIAAKRMCNRHYIAHRRPAPAKPKSLGPASRTSGAQVKPQGPCPGPECTNQIARAGLCHAHLKQKYQGKELAPIKRPRTVIPPCTFPGCDNPSQYIDALNPPARICRGHYQQRWRGDDLTPLGATVGGRKPGSSAKGAASPKRSKTPSGNLPEGWHRKTIKRKAPRPLRHEVDAGAIIVDFLIPTLPPEMYAQARRNLVAMGADDLLDMLGLEAS